MVKRGGLSRSGIVARRQWTLLVMVGLLLLMVACASGDLAGAEVGEDTAAESTELAFPTAQAAVLTVTEPGGALLTATAMQPTGTLAPQSTLVVAEVPDEVAFEGETVTGDAQAVASGLLSVSDLGIGTVDASAPLELEVGQGGTVRLEISPAFEPDDVEVEIHVTVTAIEAPVEVLNFSDELRIYSIMQAQLSAPNFDVESVTPIIQRLNVSSPAIWLWSIVPRNAGQHSVLLSVSVPIVVDGEVREISTSPLRTLEFRITVTPAPTPVPVATAPAEGFVARTVDSVSGELLAAIIVGVLGAVVTFVWRRLGEGRNGGA